MIHDNNQENDTNEKGAQSMTLPLDTRSPEQVRDEKIGQEVSDVLLDLEQSIKRARQARRVTKHAADAYTATELDVLLQALTAARKRFFQRTYFRVPGEDGETNDDR